MCVCVCVHGLTSQSARCRQEVKHGHLFVIAQANLFLVWVLLCVCVRGGTVTSLKSVSGLTDALVHIIIIIQKTQVWRRYVAKFCIKMLIQT